MVLKVIRPVDSAERCAAISKYDPNRQSRERGRRQQLSDSEKPKPAQKEQEGLDKFITSTARKPVNELSEFESLLLLRTIWEDSKKMQESTKALEIISTDTEKPAEPAYIWGFDIGARPIINR